MAVQIPFPLPSSGFALNSKVRVNLDFLVGQFNQFNTGAATWDTVAIGIANNENGTLTFYNSSNANYLSFVPGATTGNTTFTLPTGVPSVTHKFLTSDTSGVMSWSNIAEKATAYTGNLLLYLDGSSVIQELAVGSGNKVLVNSTPPSYFSLLGTTNQVTVTANSGNFTFSTPQNIDTGASVQFANLKVNAGSYSADGVFFTSSTSNLVRLFAASDGTSFNLRVGGSAGSTVFTVDNTGLGTTTGGFNTTSYRATTSFALSTSTSHILTMQMTTGGSADYTINWPNAQGGSSTVLKNDGSGNLTWVSITAIGGADQALDNLAAVAINLSLLPGSDGTIDLGSGSKHWQNLYLSSTVNAVTGTFSGTVSATIFQSTTTHLSSTGNIRLGNGDTIGWRNNANSADLTLTTNTSDVLVYSGNLQAQTLTLPTTTNQLVLGSTRTVTISATQPASSSRTYTMPDAGANASFVMTESAQTINGNKTISGTTNLSGLTASLPLQLDSSKNIVSTAIDLSTSQVTGNLGTSHLNSGTSASSSTFWRGDGTWASPTGITGTVNTGTSGDFAYYASSTNAVSDQSVLTLSSTTITVASGNLRVTGDDATNGALDINSSLAGTKLVRLFNASSNSASNLELRLQCAGVTTGGDVFVHFRNDVTPNHFSLGIDHSDSDTFKLSVASTLGTSDAITVATGGTITLKNQVTLSSDIYSVVLTEYSGTSTITGWSSFTTKSIQYKKIGKLVFLWWDLRGTSNGTTVTFTLPFTSNNTASIRGCADTTDNGTRTTTGGEFVLPGTATIQVYKDMSQASWTSSGTKETMGFIVYDATV